MSMDEEGLITKKLISLSYSMVTYSVNSLYVFSNTLSSPFMRFLFPNKNRIMQELHKWRKIINNILYTMILTKNRIM